MNVNRDHALEDVVDDGFPVQHNPAMGVDFVAFHRTDINPEVKFRLMTSLPQEPVSDQSLAQASPVSHQPGLAGGSVGYMRDGFRRSTLIKAGSFHIAKAQDLGEIAKRHGKW